MLQRVLITPANEQQYRFRSNLPMNTVILFVPQQEAWVVERMGKFYKTLSPVSEDVIDMNEEISCLIRG